jgi:hypothetical protein
MNDFLAGVAFGVLVLGLGVRIIRGQESTALQMARKEIKQGSLLTLDVTVDKAPNVNGTVFFIANPENSTGEIGSNCPVPAGQTKCQMSVAIPLDEQLGEWVISRVTFAPSAGGQKPKELVKRGDLAFQIIAHGDIVVPDGATVSEIR